MPDNNQRNLILFVLIAGVMMMAYQFFVIEPQNRAMQAARAKVAASQPAVAANAPAATASVIVPRAQALAAGPRVPIATPALTGSISLKGGRVDDLFLNKYRTTVDPKSPPVEMLTPKGAKFAYYTQSGWFGENVPGLPTEETLWTVQSGQTLTPSTPVTLTYDSGAGLVFTRRIAVDDKFLFTVTDSVVNRGTAPVTLNAFAGVQRHGLANPNGVGGVHEGAVGALDPQKPTLKLKKWKAWQKDAEKDGDFSKPQDTKGGWLGLTDKYWMAAVIPDQKETGKARFGVTNTAGVDVYDASYRSPSLSIAPGAQATETVHFFTGAKTVPVLKAYEQSLGAPRLVDAVDWGWYYFFTKPMFWLLEQLYKLFGNLGLALLGLTVVVRVLFFYPANLSYGSMAKMKKVQPEVDALRQQFKDDPQGLQRETMALYSQNKINPLMGCLPMLATIPVLFSLYKVLNVTIEMRHAPFYWLTNDLSARDPTNIWNLFGLIPWDPGHLWLIGQDGFLHLGIWAILYGFTTWLSQSMSPPAPDPTQQKIMMFMPVVFTFVLAPLAVGLLIYYTWSNLLTVLQQYILMRKHGVDNPIDTGLAKLRGKKASG